MKKLIKTIEVAHSDADYLKYELAKILNCDETEEAILSAARSHRAVAKWASKVPDDYMSKSEFDRLKLDLLELANMWEESASSHRSLSQSGIYDECAVQLVVLLDGDRSVIERVENSVGEK